MKISIKKEEDIWYKENGALTHEILKLKYQKKEA